MRLLGSSSMGLPAKVGGGKGWGTGSAGRNRSEGSRARSEASSPTSSSRAVRWAGVDPGSSNKPDWHCKDCRGSSAPWRNSGLSSYCSRCRLHKGTVHLAMPKDPQAKPSFSRTEWQARELSTCERAELLALRRSMGQRGGGGRTGDRAGKGKGLGKQHRAERGDEALCQGGSDLSGTDGTGYFSAADKLQQQ